MFQKESERREEKEHKAVDHECINRNSTEALALKPIKAVNETFTDSDYGATNLLLVFMSTPFKPISRQVDGPSRIRSLLVVLLLMSDGYPRCFTIRYPQF